MKRSEYLKAAFDNYKKGIIDADTYDATLLMIDEFCYEDEDEDEDEDVADNKDARPKVVTLDDSQLLEYKLSSEEIGGYKMLNEVVKLLHGIDTMGTVQTVDELKSEIINFTVRCNVRNIVRRGEFKW